MKGGTAGVGVVTDSAHASSRRPGNGQRWNGGLGALLQRVMAVFLATCESGLFHLQSAQKHRASTPFLNGNYAPVGEERVLHTGLKVEGQLPTELDGIYARVGPNPLHVSGDYHWFDGDGYIHAVRISNGKANYTGQYIQTSKLKQESAAGRALFSKFGDLHGPCLFGHLLVETLRDKTGILDSSQGKGTANTALVFHAGKLLALHEGDQPYELFVRDNGLIDTVRRVYKADKSLSSWFTAHTKLHAPTGKLFGFAYDLTKKPYATFYRFDQQGRRNGSVPLDFSRPVMVHDMGITANYAIIPETSLEFSIGPRLLLPGRTPFKFNPRKPTRFFVLPLNATNRSEGRWFSLPAGCFFHIAASWEESVNGGGTLIRSYILRYDKHFDLADMKTVIPDATPQQVNNSGLHLWEYVFDLPSGRATQRRVINRDYRTYEFPQVNPRTIGSTRPTRYLYAAVHDRLGRPDAFAKIDTQRVGKLDMGAVQVVALGDSVTGGEVAFVPRAGRWPWNGAEDDGYLLLFTHNDKSGTSDFRVYDARTMSSQPVARVLLPSKCRVPYGFHSLFVPEADLRAQQAALDQTQTGSS